MKDIKPSSNNILAAYAEERLLFRLGLLGIALGLIALVVMAFYGQKIEPEGYIYKAASFDIALGIYMLTLLLLVPLAGFSERGRRLWRWFSVGLLVYAYAAENIQIYRGIDPRFTRVGSAVDNVLGFLFGLTALGLIATFLAVGLRFFAKRNKVGSDLLTLGIRYGIASVVIAFAAGFWIGANQGPSIGVAGSLLPLHAAGFHGLQAVPLVALLFARTPTRFESARSWIHAAGIAWLVMCLAIAWQTATGRPVLEPSAATFLAGVLFAIWLACSFRAAIGSRRRASTEYPS